jgi:hypothetical protein
VTTGGSDHKWEVTTEEVATQRDDHTGSNACSMGQYGEVPTHGLASGKALYVMFLGQMPPL